MLERYLDELERRIEPDIEEALWAEWQDFADGNFAGAVFAPRRPSSLYRPAAPLSQSPPLCAGLSSRSPRPSGKGSHYIHRIPAMRGVYAINTSQPDYNDMETIFS